MVLEHFLKLMDFTVLLDSELWHSKDCNTGESPFNTVFLGSDLLSSKTLEYWDFLEANTQWFNTVNAHALKDSKMILYRAAPS